MEHAAVDHKWLSFAGAALSGLGATVNGLNSLYGLSVQMPEWSMGDWQVPGHALVGSLMGGAAAVTSGWLTAAKLGGASSAFTVAAVGLGAGCVYASLGFIYFIHTVVRLNTERPPRHAPLDGTPEAREYPSPQWLSTRVLNWGVIGRVGAGKSTLINTLRGLKAQDTDAAPVGVGHTTRRPSPYNFTGDVAVLTRNMARLWDLPGAGTRDWPAGTYVRDAGLRHFDGVICVTCGAFSEAEGELISQLSAFKVPYYVVRNKVDQDAVNNEQDNGSSVKETLAEIRHEMVENGCDPSRTFLLSAKHPECPDFDFGLLLRAMAADASVIRSELPEFKEEGSRFLGSKRLGHGQPLALPDLPGPPVEQASGPVTGASPAGASSSAWSSGSPPSCGPAACKGRAEAAPPGLELAPMPLFRGW
mmetsp:Transcript_92793/g.276822  ORF Transcript_92793/g.276822 Transcript_92793/m.276822 type:complete len:418 (+) Transcript_92793:184-1437(+)